MNHRYSARRLGAIVAALVAASALGGCAPLLLGGAMVGGSMVATDRRTTGAQLEDQSIELKAINRVREAIAERDRERTHVNVTSYNRQVLITGEVPTEADKASVEQNVGRTENLRGVVNDLVVTSPSTLSNRSNDTLLTSKVKASFVDAKDIISTAFKVVTERGVVYLMGRVTEREANRASDVARGVSGVLKVVRVFEVVTEAELADQPGASKAAPK
jgi:osmotically-inducible protein OsmY